MPRISPEKRAAALRANLKKRKTAQHPAKPLNPGMSAAAPAEDPTRNRAIPPEKSPEKP
jgi:hypothetical protein